MKSLVFLALLSVLSQLSWSQSSDKAVLTDTLSPKTLKDVVVRAYETNRKLIDIAAPISYTGTDALNQYSNTSILPAVNQNPGVRMEERSPGSFRLNIRGSSLRSQFGVRDVKIYYNEIPLTDPSGNTYLNALGFYDFQSIEIIKGPAASLYGAGIGGAMLVRTLPQGWKPGIQIDYSLGSFATSNFHVAARFGENQAQNQLQYSHLNSDGYRQQSASRRDVLSYETLLKSTQNQTLHAYILYSDLYYQTPGGLTLTEYNANPAQARPHAGTNPSAVQAHASIYQKMVTAGFSNEYRLSSSWKNTTAVYGSYTDFTNPGIRVYEMRKEPHLGGRSVFEYKNKFQGMEWQVHAGAEFQKGFFNTRDFTNNQGAPAALQTDDNTNIWQYLLFAQADLNFGKGWILSAGLSLNKSSVTNTRVSNLPPTIQTQTFHNKIPPRLAILKKWGPSISTYASISGGFSTPTTAELIQTTGLMNTGLQPENGIDYEIGSRGTLLQEKLYFDINLFFLDLRNTIVERIDTSGIFYYVNAGATRQNGLEGYLSYLILDHPDHFISRAKIFLSYAYDDFHYRNFIQVSNNYSGNLMPGVPRNVFVSGIDLMTIVGGYAHLNFTHTDKIWLNDANSASAPGYNLLSARVGYKKTWRKNELLEIFAGADNILNTRYSLGDDFNAAAGRYYNAAAGITYFGGIKLGFGKP